MNCTCGHLRAKEKETGNRGAEDREENMYYPAKGHLTTLQAQPNILQHPLLRPQHSELHTQQHPLLQPLHSWLTPRILWGPKIPKPATVRNATFFVKLYHKEDFSRS